MPASRRTKARLVAGYRHGKVPRAERREQLLDAALGLFARQGYEATSIEDIARAAAITRPILYDHFESKEEIYLACVSRAGAAYSERQLQAVDKAGPDPRARLEAGTRFFFEYVASDPQSWKVLFGGGAPLGGALGEKTMAMRFQTLAHIRTMMQQAAPAAAPEVVESIAHYVSGGSVYLAVWWLRNPQFSLDEIVALQLTLTWGGLGPLVGN